MGIDIYNRLSICVCFSVYMKNKKNKTMTANETNPLNTE